MNKNDDIDTELDTWINYHSRLAYIDNCIGAVGSAVLFLACLIALYFVLGVHKRKEPFLISTTILFALYSGLSIPYYILEIIKD